MQDQRLLKVEEAAKLLGVNRSTIFRWKRNGKLPYIQIESTVRFRPEDVLAVRRAS